MRQETDRALVVKWAAFQAKVATLLGDTQESAVNNQTEEAMKTLLASFRDVRKECGKMCWCRMDNRSLAQTCLVSLRHTAFPIFEDIADMSANGSERFLAQHKQDDHFITRAFFRSVIRNSGSRARRNLGVFVVVVWYLSTII